MKKVLFIMTSLIALSASAQNKGHFEVCDLGKFKLHVYDTNDALGDASYIIEGKKALVTLEHPLFKDNVAEFDAYIDKLGKPVEKRIANYHVGGTGRHDVVMAEGMPQFSKGEIYTGMMKGFEQAFGDALTEMPAGAASEVAFGTTQTWAGIPFKFSHGASSDFPGASILIGNKVYYTHWTPAKAHVSHLQISSAAAIDAEIAEAEKSLKSGAELFIGGHGGMTKTDVVKFKIEYLKAMKLLYHENTSAGAFIEAMGKAYPNLIGAQGLSDVAKALYR